MGQVYIVMGLLPVQDANLSFSVWQPAKPARSEKQSKDIFKFFITIIS